MVVTTLPPKAIPFYGNSKPIEDEFSSKKSTKRGCGTQGGKGKPGVMARSLRALENALCFGHCKVESISV